LKINKLQTLQFFNYLNLSFLFCHSEERSDEESPRVQRKRPLAYARG